MKISELSNLLKVPIIFGDPNTNVIDVVSDSKLARPGALFCAYAGHKYDGHEYIHEAIDKGAVAVLAERPVDIDKSIAYMIAKNVRELIGTAASYVWGNPSDKMLVFGITGTDGKTTTCHMLYHILASAGLKCGLISGVNINIVDQTIENSSGLTTMQPDAIQRRLAEMAEKGCQAVVIEITSHALAQGRINGCNLDIVCITRIRYDHLDYHPTEQDYVNAKAKIIEIASYSKPKSLRKTKVLNIDDKWFEYLANFPLDNQITFSPSGDSNANIYATDVVSTITELAYTMTTANGSWKVSCPVSGGFNVVNALAASACAIAANIPEPQIVNALSTFKGVPGRMQAINVGQPFNVIIDFAHSASSMEALLKDLYSKRDNGQRLIVVFGSAGEVNHDRLGMGKAAALYSDHFILTTDDPRNEDPSSICQQILEGAKTVSSKSINYEVILDRRAAIRRAIQIAGSKDIVIFAGKGHQKYMLIGDKQEPWDEQAEVVKALKEAGYESLK